MAQDAGAERSRPDFVHGDRFFGELPRMELTIDNYDDALRQTTREAKATLLAAVGIALFFWAAIFLLEDAGLGPAGFPVWFWWRWRRLRALVRRCRLAREVRFPQLFARSAPRKP